MGKNVVKKVVGNKDKTTYKNLYAFGIPAEGAKYFTLVLGRPNMVSIFLLDSNFLAENLLLKNESMKAV